MGRTDTHVAVAKNETTGQRVQFVGTKAEVEEWAAAQVKEWKKDETEVVVEKR